MAAPSVGEALLARVDPDHDVATGHGDLDPAAVPVGAEHEAGEAVVVVGGQRLAPPEVDLDAVGARLEPAVGTELPEPADVVEALPIKENTKKLFGC